MFAWERSVDGVVIGRVPVPACQAGHRPQVKQGVASGASGRQGARPLLATQSRAQATSIKVSFVPRQSLQLIEQCFHN